MKTISEKKKIILKRDLKDFDIKVWNQLPYDIYNELVCNNLVTYSSIGYLTYGKGCRIINISNKLYRISIKYKEEIELNKIYDLLINYFKIKDYGLLFNCGFEKQIRKNKLEKLKNIEK